MGMLATLIACGGEVGTSWRQPSGDQSSDDAGDGDTAHDNDAARDDDATDPSPADGSSPDDDPPGIPPLVPASNVGYEATSSAYGRLYGPGKIFIDALAYTYVKRAGGIDYAASQRFRATISGMPATIRIYSPDSYDSPGGGYACGNGGTLRARLLPDDGSADHLPDMTATPLATGTYAPAGIMTNGIYAQRSQMFPLIPLTATQTLVAGELYHLVYEQVGGDPENAFVNVNHTATSPDAGDATRWLASSDWASLYGTRPQGATAYTWRDATKEPYGSFYYVPILELTTQDGKSMGSAVLEAGNTEGSTQFVFHSGESFRERFTPSTAKTVTGISLHTAASRAGGLGWSLLHGTTVLAQGTVTQPSANYRSWVRAGFGQTYGVYEWVDIALDTPVRLAAGETYDVTFTAKDGSEWRMAVQTNGVSSGFTFPAGFSESRAQHMHGGTWIMAYQWDHASDASTQANWPIVLHLSGTIP